MIFGKGENNRKRLGKHLVGFLKNYNGREKTEIINLEFWPI